MIEVEQAGNEWRWTMISAAGRVLVQRSGYCSQTCAIGAAREYRAAFFSAGESVDHRPGVY